MDKRQIVIDAIFQPFHILQCQIGFKLMAGTTAGNRS